MLLLLPVTLRQPQQQAAMKNLYLLIMVVSHSLPIGCSYVIMILCNVYTETVATAQSEDVEPHILQRLSFSVTPECKLVSYSSVFINCTGSVMCVCTYILCVYVYAYTCMWIATYVVRTYMCICEYVYIVCLCVTCIQMCAFMRVCVCVRIWLYIYMCMSQPRLSFNL